MFIMNAEKTKIVNLSNVKYLSVDSISNTYNIIATFETWKELQRSQSILHDHWQQKQWIELLNH